MSPDADAPLCAILRRERTSILDDWEAAVRASGSPSAGLPPAELRDDIPLFVERLAIAFETGSDDVAVDQQTTGSHALRRLQLGVELRHLVHEYRLLRRIVLRHVIDGGCTGSAVVLADLMRLDDLIDAAVGETVATYARGRDESRDLVLGIIGHDLRNPLAAVVMGSAALFHATTLDEVRAVGARIKRSADRIQRVVADLLDVARARFGMQMPIALEVFDLGDVARAVVDELQVAHPDRHLELERRGDGRGSWDRARMGQLLSNLLGNAVQHGNDPITVGVTGEGDEVVLRVANRGEPIDKSALASLFDPFRRGADSGSDSARLGLGLFIVSEITRRHGGYVNVESNERETAFTVRLPRNPPEHDAPHHSC